MAMVVVLPAPFGPMKPATTPRGRSKVRGATAARCPERLVRPSTEITGAGVMRPSCGSGVMSSSVERRHFHLRGGTYESGLIGEHHELCSVPGVQLDHGATHVRACGCRTDDELCGDLLVAE